MTTNDKNFSRQNAADALAPAQQRADAFAARITGALTEQASAMPHEFAERLRSARVQAVALRKSPSAVLVAAAAPARLVVASDFAVAGHGRSAGLGTTGADFNEKPWVQFLGGLVPLMALVLGFWLMSVFTSDVRISEIAEVDAAMLQDEVPPTAYADPGFAQFLRDNR